MCLCDDPLGVIGRSFQSQVLSAIFPVKKKQAQLHSDLAVAVNFDLITQEQVEYIFKHVISFRVLREALT